MRRFNPEDIVYLWWCPGCPLIGRWQALTQTEWLHHVTAHISASRAEYLIQHNRLLSDDK